MPAEPQVSDEQVEATKRDVERHKLAETDPLVPDPNPHDTSGPTGHHLDEAADEDAHRVRVEAGKKAAETRKKNERKK